MNGDFLAVVEDVVDSIESDDSPWSVADERMQNGDFTPETMAAYRHEDNMTFEVVVAEPVVDESPRSIYLLESDTLAVEIAMT